LNIPESKLNNSTRTTLLSSFPSNKQELNESMYRRGLSNYHAMNTHSLLKEQYAIKM